MSLHKALHPRDEVDRLYVSRKKGGRGLVQNVDWIQWLEDYIEKQGGLITAIGNDTDNTMDKRMTITKNKKWEEKQLYRRLND